MWRVAPQTDGAQNLFGGPRCGSDPRSRRPRGRPGPCSGGVCRRRPGRRRRRSALGILGRRPCQSGERCGRRELRRLGRVGIERLPGQPAGFVQATERHAQDVGVVDKDPQRRLVEMAALQAPYRGQRHAGEPRNVLLRVSALVAQLPDARPVRSASPRSSGHAGTVDDVQGDRLSLSVQRPARTSTTSSPWRSAASRHSC